jgi:hypothetical protein
MEQSRASGRLMLVDGNLDLAPGLRILDAGGHTPGSQAVQIESGGSLLITGDNCYFASACRKGIVLPAAAAHEPEKNPRFCGVCAQVSGKDCHASRSGNCGRRKVSGRVFTG